MRKGIFVILAVSAVCGFLTALWVYRPKPEVTATGIEGRTFHYPETFVAKLQGDPKAGQKIYQTYCVFCHALHPEVAVHAPRIGVAEDWLRYRNLQLDTLLAMVNQGGNGMPARGGCFECDDALLKETIQYMLAQNSQSQ